jgi:hypothetical protein
MKKYQEEPEMINKKNFFNENSGILRNHEIETKRNS